MRILMFAPAFAPYMGSESLVTSKLVLALRRAGCEVDVISRREIGAYYAGDWEAPWTELRDCTQELAASSRARRLVEYVGNAVALGCINGANVGCIAGPANNASTLVPNWVGLSGSNTVVGAWLVRTAEVPEPGALAVFGLGLAGLGFARKRART